MTSLFSAEKVNKGRQFELLTRCTDRKKLYRPLFPVCGLICVYVGVMTFIRTFSANLTDIYIVS